MHNLCIYNKSFANYIIKKADNEETDVQVPMPGGPAAGAAVQIEPQKPTYPGIEYIPGFDGFNDAINRLRIAEGYLKTVKAQDARQQHALWVTKTLLDNAADLVTESMKEVYETHPPSKDLMDAKK